MALIECKIKREGGTVVLLDEASHAFMPDEAGRHICEVTDEAHVALLLEVPEAYQLVESLKSKRAKAVAKAEEVEAEEVPSQ